MKVILLQDVAKLGKRFDVVEAPHGYAMNKLIPQKMAEPATPENRKRVEARKAKLQNERTEADAAFSAALETLTGKTVSVKAEANEQGHLFKAVNEADIAAACKEEGAELQEGQILITSPIKEVGEHTVELRSGEERGELTINVEAK